jgi:hypothetical protein
MFELDPGLESVSRLLISSDYSASGGNWVVASQIFDHLSRDERM